MASRSSRRLHPMQVRIGRCRSLVVSSTLRVGNLFGFGFGVTRFGVSRRLGRVVVGLGLGVVIGTGFGRRRVGLGRRCVGFCRRRVSFGRCRVCFGFGWGRVGFGWRRVGF